MERTRRSIRLILLASIGLLMAFGAVLVFAVPSFKQAVKAQWHAFRCPAVPEQRTQLMWLASGSTDYTDPVPFGAPENEGSPNLHSGFDHDLSMAMFQTTDAFMGPKALTLTGSTSPAIVRVVRDVADSLISISAGFYLKSAEKKLDLRITVRIDRPDGSLVEWNEKRLRSEEHSAGEWERFNFEWLLRDLPVAGDDHVTIFIRNPNGAEVAIDELDIVFRSAAPLKGSS